MNAVQKHILLISNLYPNKEQPNRGIFIKQLAERINDYQKVTVISPIPWRPKIYYKLLNKPLPEEKGEINGINIYYPKHFVIPKVLRSTYGWFMKRSLQPLVKKIHALSPIDLVSAHWVYPDGYAAVEIANRLNIPVTVHALGCDINEYTKYENRKKLIIRTLENCSKAIVKSSDLALKIRSLGISEDKISTIMNGVDDRVFYKRDVKEVRNELSIANNEKVLLFVGNIQEEKGLPYLLEALSISQFSNFKLFVIGGGSDREKCEEQCRTLNIKDQVIFLGAQPHDAIPKYLNAADALCLPSLREGCPNIVLESLSCGTPVLASNVGAVPEIITQPEYGVIVKPEFPPEIAKNLEHILSLKDKQSINFQWFDWNDNAKKIIAQFESVLAEHSNT